MCVCVCGVCVCVTVRLSQGDKVEDQLTSDVVLGGGERCVGCLHGVRGAQLLHGHLELLGEPPVEARCPLQVDGIPGTAQGLQGRGGLGGS